MYSIDWRSKWKGYNFVLSKQVVAETILPASQLYPDTGMKSGEKEVV
jgi:hypothetical protein